VQERMAWAKEQTSHNTGMIMTLALNYGSRSEIVDACKSMVTAAANNGGMEHFKIDEESLNRHMYTSNLPELDLIIRTSGEMRLSNFLLWQAAYAEIYVTKTLWPDFSGLHLLESIKEFQSRERRYGGLNEPSPGSSN
jgi:undecaprenyl diphosphate synthase